VFKARVRGLCWLLLRASRRFKGKKVGAFVRRHIDPRLLSNVYYARASTEGRILTVAVRSRTGPAFWPSHVDAGPAKAGGHIIEVSPPVMLTRQAASSGICASAMETRDANHAQAILRRDPRGRASSCACLDRPAHH